MPAKTLGDFIRSKRDELDISLRELARQLEITPPFLSDIELGKRYPSENIMAKLAKFFRLPVEDLKLLDHRESLSDLKRMIEQNSQLNVAFRTAIEDVKGGKLSADELAKRINPTHQKKMKVSRAIGGRFQWRLSFSPDEIDEICIEALNKSGYMPKQPEPVRVDRFVEKYFQCNAGYEDLPPGAMGYTLFNEKGNVLQVRVSSKLEDGKRSSERRVRSTWAHEAGHCLLHPTLFIEDQGQPTFSQTEGKNTNIEGRKILCRDNDIKPTGRNYDGRWWEWQANRCIGSLLLPKKWVREALSEFLMDSVVTRSPTLLAAKRIEAEKHLAEVFDVNPVVARIRLAEMYPDSKGQIEF